MINRKRTWKDCEDPKILAVYNEVMTEAKRLYPEYFENTRYRFYIDSSTRHLGRCCYEFNKDTLWSPYGFKNHCGFIRCTDVVILLSKYLQDIRQVTSTLVHEAGHAVTPRDNHSSLWLTRSNKIGEKFGIKIEGKFANKEEVADFNANMKKAHVQREQTKYTIRCKCCGNIFHRKRMTEFVKYPWLWKCGKCNGELERIK